MTVIALSGWGQPADALREVVPHATYIDYAGAASAEAALEMLAEYKPSCVVGWSLGGQMAARAIVEHVWKPERLVLIAAPYRMRNSLTLAKFRENFLRDPVRALAKGYSLIAHKDTHGGDVEIHLQAARQRLPEHDWLYWLEELAEHGFEPESLAHFPRTVLLHGDRDAVVGLEQSHEFLKALPDAELHIFEGCGHAPHWHDAERVKAFLC